MSAGTASDHPPNPDGGDNGLSEPIAITDQGSKQTGGKGKGTGSNTRENRQSTGPRNVATGAPGSLSKRHTGGQKDVSESSSKSGVPKSKKGRGGGSVVKAHNSVGERDEKEITKHCSVTLSIAYCLSFPYGPGLGLFPRHVGTWLFAILVRHLEHAALANDRHGKPGRGQAIEAICPPLGINLSVPGTRFVVNYNPDKSFLEFMFNMREAFVAYFATQGAKERYSDLSLKIREMFSRVEDLLRNATIPERQGEESERTLLLRIAELVPECCIRITCDALEGCTVAAPTFNPWRGSVNRGFLFVESENLGMDGKHNISLSPNFLGLLFSAHEYARHFEVVDTGNQSSYVLHRCCFFTGEPRGTETRPTDFNGSILHRTRATAIVSFPQARTICLEPYVNPLSFIHPETLYLSFRDVRSERVQCAFQFPAVKNECNFSGINNGVDPKVCKINTLMIPFVLELLEVSFSHINFRLLEAKFFNYFSRYEDSATDEYEFFRLVDAQGDLMRGAYSMARGVGGGETPYSKLVKACGVPDPLGREDSGSNSS